MRIPDDIPAARKMCENNCNFTNEINLGNGKHFISNLSVGLR